MTKFILHGGYAPAAHEPDYQDVFGLLASSLARGATVVALNFAAARERQSDIFKSQQAQFASVANGRQLNFIQASEDPGSLGEQISSAAALFIRGGNELLLLPVLRALPNFVSLIDGKIIVGSSAGANTLARYYFSNSRSAVEEGLGILAIKTICHYNPTKADKLEQLKIHDESLPVYPLGEGEMVQLER